VVGPMAHDGPVQFRVKRLIDPLGTGPSGTSELPPPMLRPAQVRLLTTVPPPFCALPQVPPGGPGMKSRLVGEIGPVVDVVELEVVVDWTVDEVELVVVGTLLDEVELLVVVGTLLDEVELLVVVGTVLEDVVVGASPGHSAKSIWQ